MAQHSLERIHNNSPEKCAEGIARAAIACRGSYSCLRRYPEILLLRGFILGGLFVLFQSVTGSSRSHSLHGEDWSVSKSSPWRSGTIGSDSFPS